MKFGVITFPGSNCDDDMLYVLGEVFGYKVVHIWHKETKLVGFNPGDCIFIPGGFSFGDYLRCGAIARFSPIMEEVIRFANNGGMVIGICNGFQILCEAGLLPGQLLLNENQHFICRNVYLKAATTESPLTYDLDLNRAYKIPIAHAEGRYYADETTLANLNRNNQILFQYCDEEGHVTAASNINGSCLNIAGICNETRNVCGMMPHPERASEEALGNTDGRYLFQSLFSWLKEHYALIA
ncbi:MAG: phosphoribosylformylglycinamidine synthase subunit PurQ [Saprospiraceae bacterium]|nr:phosphoribosylformylglycinamidine synthase subunit PurQ [Candidatus Vicinibacter affinis]